MINNSVIFFIKRKQKQMRKVKTGRCSIVLGGQWMQMNEQAQTTFKML